MPTMEEEKIKKGSSSQPLQKILSTRSSLPKFYTEIQKPEKIWLMKEEGKIDSEVDSSAESETNRAKSTKPKAENNGNQDIILSEDEGHQLLHEKLAVLKAEQEKLFHETEMLKLKKEKLRLEIKLLQSKVMEDTNDVSHYIFVP